MRHGKWIAGLILGFAVLSNAGAQPVPQTRKTKSDWTLVERLPAGLPISVKAVAHWHHCAFDWADDTQMQCSIDPPPRIVSGVLVPAPYVFRRDEVRGIRVERADESTMAGAAIGASAGAILGALHPRGTPANGAALADGFIFGFLGAGVGRVVPLVHGKLIYEQAGP